MSAKIRLRTGNAKKIGEKLHRTTMFCTNRRTEECRTKKGSLALTG